MVRTGNIDFSCKRLTSIEIWKSKYHIIGRVRFRWGKYWPSPEIEQSISFSQILYVMDSAMGASFNPVEYKYHQTSPTVVRLKGRLPQKF